MKKIKVTGRPGLNSHLKQTTDQANSFLLATQKRSDRLMNYFLSGYFLVGIILAGVYDTWLIAFGVGGIALLTYYSAKILLPGSFLYQYVLSVVLGIFMAQFIYQMHGLFEMHFFAFIGSAILITYQKWKLQIPMLLVVVIHHATFGYLQDIGINRIYFTQLNYFNLQTFAVHILLTLIVYFICGLWAYQLNKYSEMHIAQALQMAGLQKEAELSNQRKQHADILYKLNTDLRRQAKELAFSNAALEQFAYATSHDLQEPLRTITSFLAILEKKYQNLIDEKGKQYINFAVDGAQRMRHIIHDLLEFSRVGKTEDKREDVNLQEMLAEITALYGKQIAEQHAKIVYSNLPTLHTFKAPIRQVFQNLIGNGLKYQQAQSHPLITISCTATDLEWQFSVEDNGIGINKEHFNDIFVIFKRLHDKEKYAGTGVGLAITKKIIDYMGGKITVASEEGKGSIFTFCLPRQDVVK
jgi:two-component system sensor histidine kinase/response regulator